MATLLKLVPELKNAIKNGNFDFWQRGTSITLTSSQYLADRFRVYHDGPYVSNVTVQRSTDVPTLAQSGFQSTYSLLISKAGGAISVGSSNYIFLSQILEGYDYQPLHGAKNIRLQFWVKANYTGTQSVHFCNSAETRVYTADYTISAANTWEMKTIDLVTDNTGTWNFDHLQGLRLGWALAAGSNLRQATGSWQTTASKYASTAQVNTFSTSAATTFQIAQVALYPIQAGSGVTLPFVRAGRNIADELSMCQRYYEKSYEIDTSPGSATTVGITSHWGANQGAGIPSAHHVFFKAQKRAAPTVVIYDAAGASGVVFTDGGNGQPLQLPANQTSIGSSGFSAGTTQATTRVIFHYTADAEL
jgi:hypothetical protein